MQELRKEVQRSSSRQRLSGFSYHSSEVQDLDLCKIELTGGGAGCGVGSRAYIAEAWALRKFSKHGHPVQGTLLI